MILCGAVSHLEAWSIYDLRCDGLEDPLGVDDLHPVFSFRLASTKGATYLSSFEIQVAEDSTFAQVLWSEDRTSQHPTIVYNGAMLSLDRHYYFRIKATSSEGEVAPYVYGSFRTGLRGDFGSAEWISSDDDHPIYNATYFRHPFEIKPLLQKAVLYVASAGPHEVHLNGSRLFEQLLNPVFVDFDDHIPYNTYEVTQYMDDHENVLGLVLGNGWYNFPEDTEWMFGSASWKDRPSVKYLLVLEYENGEIVRIPSASANVKFGKGIVAYNSIYTGEVFEYDSMMVNWSKVGFSDDSWKLSESMSLTTPVQSQKIPPIVLADTVNPSDLIRINDRKYIVVFPYNFSGIASLRLSGETGQVYDLRYGERYLENANAVDISNLAQHLFRRDTDPLDLQQDRVIFNDPGSYTFTNSFNYKGFRYIQIDSNMPFVLDFEDVKAFFVHTKTSKESAFWTSNPTINKIAEITERSYLSNFHGYPTDCPQREKNGWTGDGHLIARSALQIFDAAPLFEKWLGDHRRGQQADGNLPHILPTDSWGYEGAFFDWTASCVLVTWDLFLQSGNVRVIDDNYEMMSEFMDYWSDQYRQDLVLSGLGDWKSTGEESQSSFLSSVLYYHLSRLMSNMSELSGRSHQAEFYLHLSARILTEINETFFDPVLHTYGNGTPTEQSFALYYGVVPAAHKEAVAVVLVNSIMQADYQPGVGVLGTKTLYTTLSAFGFSDLAYDLVTSTEDPSFGYIIANGATTLTESLNYSGVGYLGSQNHPYFGSIYDYFHESLMGVKVTSGFGANAFEVRPGFPHELEELSGSYESRFGLVSVHWSRVSDDLLRYELVIPPSSDILFIPPKDMRLEDLATDNTLSDLQMQMLQAGLPLELPNGQYVFGFDPTRAPSEWLNPISSEVTIEEGQLYFQTFSDDLVSFGELEIYNLEGKLLLNRSFTDFEPHKSRLADLRNILEQSEVLLIAFSTVTLSGEKNKHLLKVKVTQ